MQQPEETVIIRQLAIFTAKANLSVNAICVGSMRSLLTTAFKEGWEQARQAGENPRPTAREVGAARSIPHLTPTLLGEALSTAAGSVRAELVEIFEQYPYVGLSIDGVTIKSRSFLNIDVVNPISDTLPFTYDFLDKSTFQTADFVEQFSTVLVRMRSENLNVAGVTSDGCSFQCKALHWRDPNSLQSLFPDFATILFAPCICHRVQNAMVYLHKKHPRYATIINQARAAAVILRKPRNRKALGLICPEHCPTRWVYDYVITRFIFNHFEDAQALLAAESFHLDEDVKFLVPLLEKLFVTVRTLECDDSSLAAVVPEIEKLAEFLLQEGMKLGGEMEDIYEAAAMNIRSRAFEKGNWIFQLAYVLTPAGREDARQRHLHAPIPAIAPPKPGDGDPGDDDPREHGGFAPSPTDRDSDGEGEDDLLQLPEDEETTEEIPESEKSDDEFPEVGREQFRLDLWGHAEDGLKDILAQFGIEGTRAETIIGIFQEYMTASSFDLRIKAIPGKNRYAWGVLKSDDSPWSALSDIALRIETLVCNEAVSERTNGAMRRLLAPLRLRMGRETLLSRLVLSKHVDSGRPLK
jgi:hypothetical protein